MCSTAPWNRSSSLACGCAITQTPTPTLPMTLSVNATTLASETSPYASGATNFVSTSVPTTPSARLTIPISTSQKLPRTSAPATAGVPAPGALVSGAVTATGSYTIAPTGREGIRLASASRTLAAPPTTQHDRRRGDNCHEQPSRGRHGRHVADADETAPAADRRLAVGWRLRTGERVGPQ